MVLLAEMNVPRDYWQLVRVLKMYPGEDDIGPRGEGVKPNGDVTVYQFQRKMYRKIIHVNYDIFANWLLSGTFHFC